VIRIPKEFVGYNYEQIKRAEARKKRDIIWIYEFWSRLIWY
jgi:hypothetical protein